MFLHTAVVVGRPVISDTGTVS